MTPDTTTEQRQPQPTEQYDYEYDWEPSDVDSFDELVDDIKNADGDRDWSFILKDHTTRGNNKIAAHVRTFNMGSATDCPNIGTDNCQVPAEECYAYKAEQRYGHPLDYRRRQEFIWDQLDAITFANAFLEMVDRERTPCSALRFNQSGDFRHRGDVIKAERIARILADHGIDVYTYSASDYLDWSITQREDSELVVNMSNFRRNYGDKHYTALPEGVKPEDHPSLDDDAVQCPYDKSDGAEEFKCGDCRLCLDKDAPSVYIELH